jgi:NAD(P)H-nitrite reductase large subunit
MIVNVKYLIVFANICAFFLIVIVKYYMCGGGKVNMLGKKKAELPEGSPPLGFDLI